MITDGPSHTEINMSDVRVGGGAVGLIFTASTLFTFLVGVPSLRWFFGGAIVVGSLVSIGLRLFHRFMPTRAVTPIIS
jgi:hypothetical protein